MNDQIIHTKASIVEAYKERLLEYACLVCMKPDKDEQQMINIAVLQLEDTLASLESQDETPSSYLEGFRDGMKATKPHPSEREVLMGFRDFYNDAVSSAVVDFSISESVIDRYLAEKYKTETK